MITSYTIHAYIHRILIVPTLLLMKFVVHSLSTLQICLDVSAHHAILPMREYHSVQIHHTFYYLKDMADTSPRHRHETYNDRLLRPI